VLLYPIGGGGARELVVSVLTRVAGVAAHPHQYMDCHQSYPFVFMVAVWGTCSSDAYGDNSLNGLQIFKMAGQCNTSNRITQPTETAKMHPGSSLIVGCGGGN